MIGLDNAKRLKELGVEGDNLGGGHYAPLTLSQLLNEVEKRGYGAIRLETEELYEPPDDYSDGWAFGCDKEWWLGEWDNATYHALAPTPEDAVALALIEILEGEK